MTKIRIVLLIVFVALSVFFFALDRAGVPLYVFPFNDPAPKEETPPPSDSGAPTMMTPMGAAPVVKPVASSSHAHRHTLSAYLGIGFAIAAGYEVIMLIIAVLVRRSKGSPSEVGMLGSLLRVGVVIALALVLLNSFGKLSVWSATAAGFAGMLLGWSLQAPVSGVAAWALVNLTRPFRVGDRVLLPAWGLIGDVEHVGILYTTLNQIGGTVGSEEPAGRRILVPNAMLFGNVVINYTPQQSAAFVLDEVVVRITFDSNWDHAERVLLEAAREVTGDIIQQTGQEPYIRSDMYDYGVYLRLRYTTNAVERPKIVHEITKRIFREFQSNSDIDFAIPYVYSYRIGLRAGAGQLDGDREAPMTEIELDRIHDLTEVSLSNEAKQQIQELAKKIATDGLLQPIVVERRTDGDYNVLAGQLRLHACKSLGWKNIPVIIKRIVDEGPA